MSKFKVGDKVKVVRSGLGFGITGDIHEIAVVGTDEYGGGSYGGSYKVKDPNVNKLRRGWVGGDSFELVEAAKTYQQQLEELLQEGGVRFSADEYIYADIIIEAEDIFKHPKTGSLYIHDTITSPTIVSTTELDHLILCLLHIREKINA